MEYTYEFLRKCHGLRFRATIYDEFQEGVIKVMTDRVMLCYGEEDPGYLVTFGRRDTLSFSEQTFSILLSDFEIVPRDPEKYTDWQVGDMISKFNENNKIVFRGGDLVFFKAPSGETSGAFTYRELFEAGYRLVRTDVEETIWRKQNWEKFHPSDGDIIYLNFGDGRKEIMVFESLDEEEDVIRGYVSVSTITGEVRIGQQLTGEFLRSVKSYRYADSFDKEYFFEKLAKAGKIWNAEKKVIEDIEQPECDEPASDEPTFKKFDPVLVRDYDGGLWKPGVFDSMRDNDNSVFKYTVMGCVPYAQCIPLNEKTEHLLGTSDNYE